MSRSPIGYLPATADVGVIAMIVLLLMRAPDRRMRAVLGLFAGGHLVSVLALPRVATKDAYSRLAPITNINVVAQLPAAERAFRDYLRLAGGKRGRA